MSTTSDLGFSELEIEQPDSEQLLWRYMDLEKFELLLQSRALYFSPLTAFQDQFEGSSPSRLSFKSVRDQIYSDDTDAQTHSAMLGKLSERVRHVARGRTFVSCWHLSNYESDAMWRLYSSSEKSVCIKTSFGKLKAQLPDAVKLGKVKYIDFDTFDIASRPTSYDPAFLKGMAFEHEREVRAVINALKDDDLKQSFYKELLLPNRAGRLIKIDLMEMIDEVLISPYAPMEFRGIVLDTARKFGFELNVSHSSINNKPVY